MGTYMCLWPNPGFETSVFDEVYVKFSKNYMIGKQFFMILQVPSAFSSMYKSSLVPRLTLTPARIRAAWGECRSGYKTSISQSIGFN